MDATNNKTYKISYHIVYKPEEFYTNKNQLKFVSELINQKLIEKLQEYDIMTPKPVDGNIYNQNASLRMYNCDKNGNGLRLKLSDLS